MSTSTSAGPAAGPALSEPRARGVVDRYMQAWNDHDGPAVTACMAEDAVYEDVPVAQVRHGRDEIASYVAEVAGFSSDWHFEAVAFFSLGSAYAVEWVMSGTNDGPLRGQPATGRPYRVRGVSVGMLGAEGLIAENRDYWNMADMLAQLGLIPA